ncbi:hypothetical protein TIFTF001_038744 [Ficus carica]|uniref:Uncharacterized protein n=1 Tax=Ficus carica TaxID=3494 RepID=A0AA88JDD0_FICCA|nr:hypothetical protein TIFTF001_038744 [Ficus carica]
MPEKKHFGRFQSPMVPSIQNRCRPPNTITVHFSPTDNEGDRHHQLFWPVFGQCHRSAAGLG